MQWSATFLLGHRCALPRVLLLHILNGAAALDTSDRESVRAGKARNDPSLPLERALKRLVDVCGVREIDDGNVTLGSADNKELTLNVHGVAPLGEVEGGRGSRGPQIPVLQCLVPRSRHQHLSCAGIGGVNESYGFYRIVVSRDLCRLSGLEVEEPRGLVCAARNNLGSILHAQLAQSMQYTRLSPTNIPLTSVPTMLDPHAHKEPFPATGRR